MAVDRSYVAINEAERRRLEAFVARCSDADLAHPMPAGWTVAAILAHLAFWDERVRILFEQWERDGADRAVERLSDAMLLRNAEAGHRLNVVRAEHRRQHLDELERMLG